MEAVSDEACLPAMRDLCLQLLANVTRVQVNERVACMPMLVSVVRVVCCLSCGLCVGCWAWLIVRLGVVRSVRCVAFRVVCCCAVC